MPNPFFPGQSDYLDKLNEMHADSALGVRTDLSASSGAGMVGWIRNAVGAVFRWISDKLEETVSVKDFGVVGDGTDERTRFTNALAALAPGVSLDLCGLSIVCGNALTITDKANIKIKNGTLVGKLTDAAGYALDLSSCTDVRLRRLKFDSKNSYVSGPQLSAVRLTNCSDVMLDGVNFADCYAGVVTGGSSNERIRLHNCRQIGRLAYSAPNAAAYLLSESMFYAFGPTFDSGVSYSYAEKVSHLVLTEDTSADIYSNYNTVKNSHDTAIYFYCPGAVAHGNKIYYAGKDGIKANGLLATGARFTKNRVYGSGVIKSDGGTCLVSLSEDAVITGNVVYLLPLASRASSTTNGIVAYNSEQVVATNVIKNLALVSEAGSVGIALGTVLSADASGINIGGNIIRNVYEAIKWGQPNHNYSNVSAHHNQIIGCVRGIYGFLSDETYAKVNYVDLDSNKITNYSDCAIVINMSDHLTVANNRGYEIGGTSGTFFKNYACHGVVFTNNTTDGNESTFKTDVGVNTQVPIYAAQYGNMSGSTPKSPSAPPVGYTTVARPAASTVAAGASIWNTTTHKPNWSDGAANWYDAAGTIV